MSDSKSQRSVLVTGGTGALGRAVVRRLDQLGHTVHATWFHEREADELRALLGDAADRVAMHQADLTSEPAVRRLFRTVQDQTGTIDVLANIVGAFVFAPVDETDGETWNRMIATNATSAFLCSGAAVSGMREKGWGRIVNVASGPALGWGGANMSAYAASKAAVLNLTYSLSQELVTHGVTVNAIVPSIIDTEANRQAMPDADRSTWLQPDDIADVIAFLVSDDARIVSGTAVNLTRG